jgi:hypothetical protein
MVRRKSSLNILRTRVWEKNRASAKFRSERPASLDLIAYLFKEVYQDNRKQLRQKKSLSWSQTYVFVKAQLPFYSTILNTHLQ